MAITFPASGSVVTPDTFAITTSASVQAGDLLIFQVAFNDINDEPAPPTGPGSAETRIDSGTFYFHSSPAHQSYWYTAVAAGPSETYTWSSFNDGNHMNITYVACRGCSTTLEAHNGAIHGVANTSHTSDSVTATDTTRMLLLMVGVTSQPTNDISATGFTQLIDTQDANGTTNVEIYAGHKTAASGAQTATFALNTEAEKACSMLFVLAPTVGGGSVSGTAAAALGGLTGATSGTRTVSGTAAASLGGLTGTVVGKRTVLGTAAKNLGGLAATAAGTRTVLGTAAVVLGRAIATASGTRTTLGAGAAALGRAVGAASGLRTTAGTAAAPLGGLAGTATVGASTKTGTAAAVLGALSSGAVGTRTVLGAGTAALGRLTAAGTVPAAASTGMVGNVHGPLPVVIGAVTVHTVSIAGAINN